MEELDTIPISACCHAPVYTKFIKDEIKRDLINEGYVPGADFAYLTDQTFCEECLSPCKTVKKLI